MRVGVELRVRPGHPLHPGDRRDAPQPAPRSRHAAADLGMPQNRMDRLVRGVEQVLDVDPRLRRPEPQALVGLVPDQPVLDPRVAAGDGVREGAHVSRMRRREVRGAPAVRPGRRADQRHHRRQAVAAQPAQDPVRTVPVVSAVAHVIRIRRSLRRDVVPVDREADERDAKPLERRKALVELPRTELEPRVVLNPVAHAVGCLR